MERWRVALAATGLLVMFLASPANSREITFDLEDRDYLPSPLGSEPAAGNFFIVVIKLGPRTPIDTGKEKGRPLPKSIEVHLLDVSRFEGTATNRKNRAEVIDDSLDYKMSSTQPEPGFVTVTGDSRATVALNEDKLSYRVRVDSFDYGGRCVVFVPAATRGKTRLRVPIDEDGAEGAGDGLPDAWERRPAIGGTHVLTSDSADDDLDGTSNFEEFRGYYLEDGKHHRLDEAPNKLGTRTFKGGPRVRDLFLVDEGSTRFPNVRTSASNAFPSVDLLDDPTTLPEPRKGQPAVHFMKSDQGERPPTQTLPSDDATTITFIRSLKLESFELSIIANRNTPEALRRKDVFAPRLVMRSGGPRGAGAIALAASPVFRWHHPAPVIVFPERITELVDKAASETRAARRKLLYNRMMAHEVLGHRLTLVHYTRQLVIGKKGEFAALSEITIHDAILFKRVSGDWAVGVTLLGELQEEGASHLESAREVFVVTADKKLKSFPLRVLDSPAKLKGNPPIMATAYSVDPASQVEFNRLIDRTSATKVGLTIEVFNNRVMDAIAAVVLGDQTMWSSPPAFDDKRVMDVK